MATWFTSDWHLGHKSVLTLGEGRPFATIEEHDAALVARHNALVAPDDEVWVLGDVAMGTIGESLARCAQMNGRKILVCGNHDRPAMTEDPDKRAAWVDRYLSEGGFTRVLVVERGTTVQPLGGRIVLVSHYPYAGDSGETDRYPDRRPVDYGDWLLHGHVHHAWRVDGRQINVGVDAWGYEPVLAQAIMSIVETAPRSHRCG